MQHAGLTFTDKKKKVNFTGVTTSHNLNMQKVTDSDCFFFLKESFEHYRLISFCCILIPVLIGLA